MPFILPLHLSLTPTSPSLIKQPEIESPYSDVSASEKGWPAKRLGQHWLVSWGRPQKYSPSTFPSLADWCRSYLSYAFSGLQGSPRTWERRLDILLIGTASGFYFQNWESQIVLTAAQEWKELRPLSRSRWPVSEDCGPRWPGSPLQSKSAPSLVSCPRLPINSQCFGWLLGQSDYSLIRHLE